MKKIIKGLFKSAHTLVRKRKAEKIIVAIFHFPEWQGRKKVEMFWKCKRKRVQRINLRENSSQRCNDDESTSIFFLRFVFAFPFFFFTQKNISISPLKKDAHLWHRWTHLWTHNYANKDALIFSTACLNEFLGKNNSNWQGYSSNIKRNHIIGSEIMDSHFLVYCYVENNIYTLFPWFELKYARS